MADISFNFTSHISNLNNALTYPSIPATTLNKNAIPTVVISEEPPKKIQDWSWLTTAALLLVISIIIMIVVGVIWSASKSNYGTRSSKKYNW